MHNSSTCARPEQTAACVVLVGYHCSNTHGGEKAPARVHLSVLTLGKIVRAFVPRQDAALGNASGEENRVSPSFFSFLLGAALFS